MNRKQTTLTLALGSAIAASFVAAPVSADSVFSAEALKGGYMVADHHMAKEKAKEGKCAGDAKAKAKEGNCGAKEMGKGKEGKCGEGKCGNNKAKDAKAKEGKCGGGDKAKEGKCAGNK